MVIKRKNSLELVRWENEPKPCSPTEWLGEVWGKWRKSNGAIAEWNDWNARAASELSEGGSTKRDPEGNVCDLCSMHKGLAHFDGAQRRRVFENRCRIEYKCEKWQ